MLNNHCLSFQCTLMNDFVNLTINFTFHLFTIWFQILDFRESNISNLFMHTKLSYNLIGEVVSFLEVIISSGSYLLKEMKLCTSSTENKTNSIKKLLFGLELILINKILGKSQSTF